jgi:hypothetical protein
MADLKHDVLLGVSGMALNMVVSKFQEGLNFGDSLRRSALLGGCIIVANYASDLITNKEHATLAGNMTNMLVSPALTGGLYLLSTNYFGYDLRNTPEGLAPVGVVVDLLID